MYLKVLVLNNNIRTQIYYSLFVFTAETYELLDNGIDNRVIEVERNWAYNLSIWSPPTHHIWFKGIVLCGDLNSWRNLIENVSSLTLIAYYFHYAIFTISFVIALI